MFGHLEKYHDKKRALYNFNIGNYYFSYCYSNNKHVP